MRVKSRRFPTIEKDMKMVLAHCGSLYLDPAFLMQVRFTGYSSTSMHLQIVHVQINLSLRSWVYASGTHRHMPVVGAQVYHEMVVMERIHQNQIYSPGVSLEGLTRPPLRLH